MDFVKFHCVNLRYYLHDCNCSYLMPTSHLGGRISKAGSHMSVAQSRKHSTLRPGDHLDGYAHSAYIYPNYYVSVNNY